MSTLVPICLRGTPSTMSANCVYGSSKFNQRRAAPIQKYRTAVESSQADLVVRVLAKQELPRASFGLKSHFRAPVNVWTLFPWGRKLYRLLGRQTKTFNWALFFIAMKSGRLIVHVCGSVWARDSDTSALWYLLWSLRLLLLLLLLLLLSRLLLVFAMSTLHANRRVVNHTTTATVCSQNLFTCPLKLHRPSTAERLSRATVRSAWDVRLSADASDVARSTSALTSARWDDVRVSVIPSQFASCRKLNMACGPSSRCVDRSCGDFLGVMMQGVLMRRATEDPAPLTSAFEGTSLLIKVALPETLSFCSKFVRFSVLAKLRRRLNPMIFAASVSISIAH